MALMNFSVVAFDLDMVYMVLSWKKGRGVGGISSV